MDAYIYEAALICEGCACRLQQTLAQPRGMDPSDESTWDSDDYPKGPYQDGGGEADRPQHCDHCHIFLENPLTEDGVQYVKDSLDAYIAADDLEIDPQMVADRAEDDGRHVAAQWARFYHWIWD